MSGTLVGYFYLISAVLFILALKGLSSPLNARRGNMLGIIGMTIAIVTTILHPDVVSYGWVIIALVIGGGIGTVVAKKIEMTALPELVAAFHSLVGLAQHPLNLLISLTMLALLVYFCRTESYPAFWGLLILSFVIGFLLIVPIGGADMPVVVSMLNSYSGWAAAGIGFTLGNSALIITGALVGSSGAILSYIMCKGMNRSIINVLLGGFGGDSAAGPGATSDPERQAKAGAAPDAAFIMGNASKVIIVPGYGMAVAQAQHAVREMADKLKAEGVEVKYAIHPVAGRMPGHMNVLLAEANVPYDEVFELEEINHEFATADVAYVIGANDVTNPIAKTDPTSPIAGMPILDVEKAGTVLFVKRSLSPGYAGVDNPLFYADNTMMLFGDAKEMTEKIVSGLE